MSHPLRPPHLRHRLPAHEAAKPTWLELFYDLVFVAVLILRDTLQLPAKKDA